MSVYYRKDPATRSSPKRNLDQKAKGLCKVWGRLRLKLGRVLEVGRSGAHNPSEPPQRSLDWSKAFVRGKSAKSALRDRPRVEVGMRDLRREGWIDRWRVLLGGIRRD